jgi:DNA-binding HxlR family transcriptional regulator
MASVEKELKNAKSCSHQFVLAINSTLEVLNGKWKLPIIGALLFGKKRFTELERGIPNITARMLSKELKDLEASGLINRTVYDTTPVTVEYELTRSGKDLTQVLDSMVSWRLQHKNCG